MLYNPFLRLEWCGKSTRNACKYRRFGRFPVAEKQVLQYKVNPITEPLDGCLAERLFLAEFTKPIRRTPDLHDT